MRWDADREKELAEYRRALDEVARTENRSHSWADTMELYARRFLAWRDDDDPHWWRRGSAGY